MVSIVDEKRQEGRTVSLVMEFRGKKKEFSLLKGRGTHENGERNDEAGNNVRFGRHEY